MFGEHSHNAHLFDQSTQGSSLFGRQDSFAVISSMQQKDQERNDALNFLETKMDIEEYLSTIEKTTGVPREYVEFDDGELEKTHILVNPEHESSVYFFGTEEDKDPAIEVEAYGYQYEMPQPFQPPDSPVSREPSVTTVDSSVYVNAASREQSKQPSDEEQYVSPTAFRPESPVSRSKPSSSRPFRSAKRTRQEPYDEDYTPTTSKRQKKPETVFDFTPETVARKYCPKDTTEKIKPEYKLKRAKNNDAVRKSRSKAKEAQEKRDEELLQLRNATKEYIAKIRVLEKQIKERDDIIRQLTRK